MSHVSRTITTDRVFANPALMHRAELEALVHLHNPNLNDEEDFGDADDELEELEVMGEEEFFTHYIDAIDLDPSFD